MLKFILLFNATGEDIPPMQLKEGVFRCILQLYDCLLTEVHERWKKWPNLAKRLNSSLAFFCYDRSFNVLADASEKRLVPPSLPTCLDFFPDAHCMK